MNSSKHLSCPVTLSVCLHHTGITHLSTAYTWFCDICSNTCSNTSYQLKHTFTLCCVRCSWPTCKVQDSVKPWKGATSELALVRIKQLGITGYSARSINTGCKGLFIVLKLWTMVTVIPDVKEVKDFFLKAFRNILWWHTYCVKGWQSRPYTDTRGHPMSVKWEEGFCW